MHGVQLYTAQYRQHTALRSAAPVQRSQYLCATVRTVPSAAAEIYTGHSCEMAAAYYAAHAERQRRQSTAQYMQSTGQSSVGTR